MEIYRLPNKLPDEEIIKILRKDLFILVKKIALFVLLVILPMVVFYLMLAAFPALPAGAVSYPLIILATSAYYLFIWLFFFFTFIDYYLDVWLIYL